MELTQAITPIDHQLLLALMETIPDRIYFKDTEGRFVAVNQATLDFLEADEDEVLGRTDFDFFLPAHANQTLADEQQVIKTGQPVVSKMEREELPDGYVGWVSTTKVPMRDEAGRIIGICGITRDVTEEHDKNEQLKQFADAMGDREEALQKDLMLAQQVQMAMLPQTYPVFPRGAEAAESALRFAHRYLPEGSVGGDFFTVIAIADNLAGVLISDVMGHGVHAALVTAVQRTLVEELQPFAPDPGAFLTELNARLHHFFVPLPNPMYVTALYLVVDTMTGEIRFANAGHPDPIHIGDEDRAVTLLDSVPETPQLPLGVAPDSIYSTERAQMQPGDTLLLYTDGLHDLGEGNELAPGDGRFLELIARAAAGRGEQLLEKVLANARRLAGQEQFLDDVCLVAIDLTRLTARPAQQLLPRWKPPAGKAD